MNDRSRCLRRIALTYEALSHLLADGKSFRVKGGLPADAEIVSIFSNDAAKEIFAIIRSERYAPLAKGEVIYDTCVPVIERIG
jgi:hypothetical protein